MKTPVSIIIPAFNQLEYCRQCVASILANTAGAYRLILVDNGSTDGVGAYFDSVPGATVIHAEKNLGFAGGVNLGLARSEGHVLLLNSDTLAPPGWLARLEDALLRFDDVGMVGPRSNYVSGSQLIPSLSFRSTDEIAAFSDGLAAKHAAELRGVARLVGFCLLIRDRVVREVGSFDEDFGIGNFEDDDYCLRALRAGWRLCVAEDCFVFHYGNRTFAAMGMTEDEAWQQHLSRNETLFVRKHRVSPLERSDSYQHARHLNASARKALEAGDSAGAVRLLMAGVEADGRYAMNFNDLGALLWGGGEHERAYAQFERAVQADRDCAEARENLLHAAEQLGRSEEARRLLAG